MSDTMQKPMRKNITKLFWMSIFSDVGFHWTVYTLFLLSKGFSMEQFFMIEAAYSLALIVAEIPTGAFSDRVSRRWSLVISSLIEIVTIPIIIMTHNFYTMLIAQAIAGVAFSFSSGTDSAILYDSVKSMGEEKNFKQIIGKRDWYASWSTALGAIVAGILAHFDLSYAWWAYFVASLGLLFVRLSLVEPPLHKSRECDQTTYYKHLGESVGYTFRGETAIFVLYWALMWMFFSFTFYLKQPYLKLIGMPVLYFGIIYAAFNIIGGIASKYAYKIEKNLGVGLSLVAIPLVVSVQLLFQSQILTIFAFLLLLVQSFPGGYMGPILSDYINSRIPSERRATVLSIKSMLSDGMFVILAPLFGLYIDRTSVPSGYFLLSIVIFASAVFFFIKLRKIRGAFAPTSEIIDSVEDVGIKGQKNI